MAEKRHKRVGTGSEILAWPPQPDARYDPLVFDTNQKILLSMDQATAGDEHPATPFRPATLQTDADSLASFSPEKTFEPRERDAMLQPSVRGWRRGTRIVIAALVLLVAAQAAVLVYVMRGRTATPPPQVAPVTEGPSTDLSPITGPEQPTSDPPVTAPAPRTEGRLVVNSTAPGAGVLIDGRRRGTAPLTIERLSPGTHRVQVESGGVSVDQRVTIEAGTTTSVLIPVAQSGWVSIDAPLDIRILEKGQLLGTSASGPIKLKPGTHTLDLVNDTLGYAASERVTVSPGELSRVKPAVPDGVLQVNALPWAHVWVDGRPVGDTPLGTLRASLGPHEIRFQHPEHGEQIRHVVVSASAPTRVSVDLRK